MSDQTEVKPFGPFNKENFNTARWKHIKEKIFHLNSTNEEETIPDCKDLLQLLHELNAAEDVDKYFGEPSIKSFFYNEFFLTNAKNLIATKTFNNPEILELSNMCLEEMVFFWLKTIYDDNIKMTDTARVILDPTRTYYKLNDQEEVAPTVLVRECFMYEAAHALWIIVF